MPRADIQAPERAVSEEQGPNVRITQAGDLSAFGGGPTLERFEQTGQEVGRNLSQIASDQMIAADNTQIMKMADLLGRARTDIMYNPQSGIITRKGEKAFTAPEDANAAFEKASGRIGEMATTDRQRMMFQHLREKDGVALNDEVQKHVYMERKDYEKDTYNSLIENEINSASLAYSDPNRLGQHLMTIHAATMDYANDNGLPKEWVDAKSRELMSKAHLAVLGSMADNQHHDMAKQYFDQFRDSMTPQGREAAAKLVGEASIRGESHGNADDFWAKSGGDLGKSLTLTEKIKDPDVRDRTREYLKQKNEDAEATFKANDDKAFRDAMTLIGQKGGQVGQGKTVTDLVPPSLWASMTPDKQEAIKRYYSNVEGGDAKWYDYMMLSPEAKKGLSEDDLKVQYLSFLDPKKRDQAIKMWESAKRDSIDALNDSQRKELVWGNAAQTGIIPGLTMDRDPKKIPNKSKAAFSLFNDEITQAVKDYEVNKMGGRGHASAEEVQKIIDQHIISRMSGQKPSVFDVGAQLLGLSKAPAVHFDDIPDDAKEDLLQGARKMNRAITKDQIEKAYPFYQKGDLVSVKKVLS